MEQIVIDSAKMWAKAPFDAATISEVESLLSSNNERELTDRFYKGLEFGTGGMRGVIGAGTNRINIYTVRKASQGLALYIKKLGEKACRKGVVISYDSRNFSHVFAKEAAMVFAGNGIKSYIFEEIRPLPEMSFAVRHYKAQAGIMITASHNPPEYNGYKVSWEDGCQVVSPHDSGIIEEVNSIADFFDSIKTMDFEKGLESGIIQHILGEVDTIYLNALLCRVVDKATVDKVKDTIKLVYTPLHGAGIALVPKMVENLGIKNLYIVEEQKTPDGNFPTVKSPNPEEQEALAMGIELAKQKKADIVLATDPDGDRLGIAVRDAKTGDFTLLNGNQLGSLMTWYVLEKLSQKNESLKGRVVVKTIVTTDLVRSIAQKFKVDVVEVLTGFKYIGSVIREYEEEGSSAEKFIFGFEESYGFLLGTDVRDKDAIIACQLAIELAAYAYGQGKTIVNLLDEVYEEFGYYSEKLLSFTFKGYDGTMKIKAIMDKLRNSPASVINSEKVVEIIDISTSQKRKPDGTVLGSVELPRSNVLVFKLAGGTAFAVRPSGTEPKIKFYIFGNSKKGSLQEKKGEVESVLQSVAAYIKGFVDSF